MKKYSCFFISPIGEIGSSERKNSDHLLQLVIKPCLEKYGFEVVRGDHRNESGQIDIDVIRMVQDSDLCIADLSSSNINVYYELGRRDETAKPIILLKSHESDKLPVDIGTRRYIEYNLFDLDAILTTKEKLEDSVKQLYDNGFQSSKGITLRDISNQLERIERKIEKNNTERHSEYPVLDINNEIDPNISPAELLKVALAERNVKLAESCMDKLGTQIEDTLTFYNYIVEQVAGIGSKRASEMLIKFAEEYFDNETDKQQKKDYLAYLIAAISHTDKEVSCKQLFDNISALLVEEFEEESVIDQAYLYNQISRYYYSLFVSTSDEEHLLYSMANVNKAINLSEEPSYLYNMAMCEEKYYELNLEDESISNYIELAKKHIDRCLLLSENNEDLDHLELAYKIYKILNLPECDNIISKIQMISPIKARVLQLS